MARIVKLSAQAPVKIEPGDKPVWVCACGLSQKFPICDGSHKQCPAREPDPHAEYVYDETRTRVVDVKRPREHPEHPHI